jgi:hypothetical protein
MPNIPSPSECEGRSVQLSDAMLTKKAISLALSQKVEDSRKSYTSKNNHNADEKPVKIDIFDKEAKYALANKSVIKRFYSAYGWRVEIEENSKGTARCTFHDDFSWNDYHKPHIRDSRNHYTYCTTDYIVRQMLRQEYYTLFEAAKKAIAKNLELKDLFTTIRTWDDVNCVTMECLKCDYSIGIDLKISIGPRHWQSFIAWAADGFLQSGWILTATEYKKCISFLLKPAKAAKSAEQTKEMNGVMICSEFLDQMIINTFCKKIFLETRKQLLKKFNGEPIVPLRDFDFDSFDSRKHIREKVKEKVRNELRNAGWKVEFRNYPRRPNQSKSSTDLACKLVLSK